jgi:hypothetical protein
VLSKLLADGIQVVAGELLLNGKPYNIAELKKMSGYVMQVSLSTGPPR